MIHETCNKAPTGLNHETRNSVICFQFPVSCRAKYYKKWLVSCYMLHVLSIGLHSVSCFRTFDPCVALPLFHVSCSFISLLQLLLQMQLWYRAVAVSVAVQVKPAALMQDRAVADAV